MIVKVSEWCGVAIIVCVTALIAVGTLVAINDAIKYMMS